MTNIYKPLKNPDEDKLKMQSTETVSTAARPVESSIAVSDKPAEYSQASIQTTTETQPAQPAPAETQSAPAEPEPTQPTQSEPSAASETSPASPASQEEEEPLYVGGYEMPSYEESPWAAKAKEVLEQYDGYTYEDFLASPQYQELQEQYAMAGQQSMKDTLGQVSARTGGIASTYATAAAQKNYDQFMRALFEVANQMYDAEREEIKSKYGLYDAEEDEDYDRYLDSLNFAYNVAVYNDQNKQPETPATDTVPELTPQQAQRIYDEANNTMAEQGINIPGMLSYEDWQKVQNDPNGAWQPGYGVTQIGYDIARNSKTYEEYAQNFMDYMNQNYAAPATSTTENAGRSELVWQATENLVSDNATTAEIMAYIDKCGPQNNGLIDADTVAAYKEKVMEALYQRELDYLNVVLRDTDTEEINNDSYERATEYLDDAKDNLGYELYNRLMIYCNQLKW
ncbi:MAG: hypothetical protein IJF14_03790 [Clostridia bacterium]|nr:hypothetical protein [Clostridia bacterium]